MGWSGILLICCSSHIVLVLLFLLPVHVCLSAHIVLFFLSWFGAWNSITTFCMVTSSLTASSHFLISWISYYPALQNSLLALQIRNLIDRQRWFLFKIIPTSYEAMTTKRSETYPQTNKLEQNCIIWHRSRAYADQ